MTFTIIIIFILPCKSDDSSSLRKSVCACGLPSLAGLAEVVSITHFVSNERPPTSSPCISANSERQKEFYVHYKIYYITFKNSVQLILNDVTGKL